jgi:hypothetical protein
MIKKTLPLLAVLGLAVLPSAASAWNTGGTSYDESPQEETLECPKGEVVTGLKVTKQPDDDHAVLSVVPICSPMPQGPTGPTGATGPQGAPGVSGAVGAQGPAGDAATQLGPVHITKVAHKAAKCRRGTRRVTKHGPCLRIRSNVITPKFTG